MSDMDSCKQTRMRLKAQQSINEKPELVSDQLNTLRCLLREDKKLRCPMEDAFLMRFMRARKFNLERALKLVKHFFEMKVKLHFMTVNLYPSEFEDLYATRFATALKHRDNLGRKIMLLRTDKWNTREYCLDDIFKSCFLLLDEMVASEETQLYGVSIIIDFTGFGFNHVRQFTPVRIQQLVQMLQDSYPVRFKEFHCIFHPFIFNMVYSIIKPFLKEKMRKRFTFHGYELFSLHKFINPEILPVRLGGVLEEDEFPDLALLKRLYEKEEYYKELMTYGYPCQ